MTLPLDQLHERLGQVRNDILLLDEELKQPALPGFETAKEAFHRNRWGLLHNLTRERESLEASILDLGGIPQ